MLKEAKQSLLSEPLRARTSPKGTKFNSVGWTPAISAADRSVAESDTLMAQTHVSLYVHVVFSTKNRVGLITLEIESELFAYMGGIVRNYACRLIAANGT